MPFDLKSFAEQVRPSPSRPSAPPFANSVFDAGSPQYVRPEDLFLDIQARMFNIKRLGAQDLDRIDPSDFRTRWLRQGAGALTLQRIGPVEDGHIADAIMGLLRCSQRRKEKHPTLLPVSPRLCVYKNIKPNLPNFYNDQLRPALSFADAVVFSQRIEALKERLALGTQDDDSLKLLARSLLPVDAALMVNARGASPIHDGPLLQDYSCNPVRILPVCGGLAQVIDTLIEFEGRLPRILWTRWLTATLRLWLPLFFLKRCSVTTQAVRIVKGVLATKNVASPDAISSELFGTNSLLRGSKEWINQLSPIIQDYVRARLELSILLELCNLHERLVAQGYDPRNSAHADNIDQELAAYEVKSGTPHHTPFPQAAGICNKGKLAMPGDPDSRWLSFDEWLVWIKDHVEALDALSRRIGADDTRSLLERVYAFIRPAYEPLRSGFGKNAYEYVAFALGAPRKTERDPEFPDEFNLIFRGEGGRRARHVMLQPGPELLALLVQLVSYQAHGQSRATAKLSDLLDLFDSLGIDFRSIPEDFDALKSDLLKLGLLQSSADAAEAASLKPVYTLS